MSALDPYDYLASNAAELAAKFPTCKEYIFQLLEKYKKAAVAGLIDLRGSPTAVSAQFENDVRKHCAKVESSSLF